MNNWNGSGRLTKDPEIKYSGTSNIAICKFTVAVDRPVKQGAEKKADFIPVTVFGKSAEFCGKHLHKGKLCWVQGRIQTGSYENKEGRMIYTTDIIADRVEMELPKNQEQPAPDPIEEPAFVEDVPDGDAEF